MGNLEQLGSPAEDSDTRLCLQLAGASLVQAGAGRELIKGIWTQLVPGSSPALPQIPRAASSTSPPAVSPKGEA